MGEFAGCVHRIDKILDTNCAVNILVCVAHQCRLLLFGNMLHSGVNKLSGMCRFYRQAVSRSHIGYPLQESRLLAGVRPANSASGDERPPGAFWGTGDRSISTLHVHFRPPTTLMQCARQSVSLCAASVGWAKRTNTEEIAVRKSVDDRNGLLCRSTSAGPPCTACHPRQVASHRLAPDRLCPQARCASNDHGNRIPVGRRSVFRGVAQIGAKSPLLIQAVRKTIRSGPPYQPRTLPANQSLPRQRRTSGSHCRALASQWHPRPPITNHRSLITDH